MKQRDMHVVSLIKDYILYTYKTQVSLFVCWGIGKLTSSCIVLFFLLLLLFTLLLLPPSSSLLLLGL